MTRPTPAAAPAAAPVAPEAPANDHEPALTRILAIRHGETAWNRETRMQGQLDIELSDAGHRQAACLARALADEAIDAVYSSDLARALQTALPLASPRRIRVTADPGLRERCFGVFEGLTYRDVAVRWPDDAERWHQRDPGYGPAGGEALRDFDARCVAALTRIAAAHPGRNIAIVTHGGVLDCLYRAAARIDLGAPRSWEIGNASIHRLLFTELGFTLVGWGDTAHLEQGALDDADPAPAANALQSLAGTAA